MRTNVIFKFKKRLLIVKQSFKLSYIALFLSLHLFCCGEETGTPVCEWRSADNLQEFLSPFTQVQEFELRLAERAFTQNAISSPQTASSQWLLL